MLYCDQMLKFARFLTENLHREDFYLEIFLQVVMVAWKS